MTDRTWSLLLPAGVRAIPVDLALVGVVTALTALSVALPVVRDTPLRAVLAVPFILFCPGYAVVSALYPDRFRDAGSTQTTERPDQTRDPEASLTVLERIALSFATSLAIVPLIGVTLNVTWFGVRLVPVVISLCLITGAATVLAVYRRHRLSADERFRIGQRVTVESTVATLRGENSRTDTLLNLALAVAVVLSVVSVGAAVALQSHAAPSTEFYLLSEDDGRMNAEGYPTEFTAGEGQNLTVGITNLEREIRQYTVVVELQRMAEDNETVVTNATEVDRFRTTLGHNETWRRTHEVRPAVTGERLRLTYLLYVGDPPTTTSTETAYRSTHLWITVREGGQSRS